MSSLHFSVSFVSLVVINKLAIPDVTAHLTWPLAAQGGAVVSSAVDMYGQCDTFASNSSASGIGAQFEEGWRAGVWSSVKGAKKSSLLA